MSDPSAPRGERSETVGQELVRRSIAAGADLWQQVAPHWQRLLEETGETSAFLSEAWVGCWLRHFGEQTGANALLWSTADGAPVGCVLRSSGRTRMGPFPVSQSYLNASGVSQIGCEHNDVLVVDAYRSRVLDDLASAWLDERTDEYALFGVRKSTFDELLSRWPTPTWDGYHSESPYVDLNEIRASGEDYLMSLSGNSRSQIRRSLRLYEQQLGEPTVDVAASTEEAQAWLTELIGLHETRWLAKGEVGAFSTEAARNFYRGLIEECTGVTSADRLRVDLVRIRFGSEVVGVLLNLSFRSRVSFYQSGLQYDDDGRLKPGLVTHALAIRHYLGTDADEYDFLGGEASSVRYKRSLATAHRSLVWGRLPATGLKMTLLRRLRALRHVLRTDPTREPHGSA